MIAAFPLPLLADGAPPSATEIGEWLKAFFWLVGGAAACAALWRGIKPPKPLAIAQPLTIKTSESVIVEMAKEFATTAALHKLEADVQAQLKEFRSYLHEQQHEVRDQLHALRTSADAGREGLHGRINSLIELTAHMRGQMDTVLDHSRKVANAAERAAHAAEQASKA